MDRSEKDHKQQVKQFTQKYRDEFHRTLTICKFLAPGFKERYWQKLFDDGDGFERIDDAIVLYVFLSLKDVRKASSIFIPPDAEMTYP